MAGLVHIYTGNGKGKTTAAVGLGIRAYGNGFKVLMVQFLKGAPTGELKVLENLEPDFTLHRGKQVKGFVWNMTEEQREETRLSTVEAFKYAFDAAMNGSCDMIILDELMGCISNKFIPAEEVAKLIRNKPEKLEIVMTGRNAPRDLIELADYVSEVGCIKHPMEKGISARKGIEF